MMWMCIVWLCPALAATATMLSTTPRPTCVCLADDDLRYTSAQLREVIDIFGRDPDTVLAAFRYDPPGRKPYPDTVTDISRGFPKTHGGVTTIEMAFRRRAVVDAGVRFCELAGPGAPVLQAAEDELFLEAVRRRRLRCVYYPFTVCRHCGGTPTRCAPIDSRSRQGRRGGYRRDASVDGGTAHTPVGVAPLASRTVPPASWPRAPNPRRPLRLAPPPPLIRGCGSARGADGFDAAFGVERH